MKMARFSCIALLLTLTAAQAEPCKIFQSTVNSHTFYHIEFTLTASNSTAAVPQGYQDSLWRPETNSIFQDTGMFEVFIRADAFPISAPGCIGGWIILRMPSTFGTDKEAQNKIAAKKALWENLQTIYKSKSGSQKVVIELNPYIRVIDSAEPRIELEECNVFFRQAQGSYVPYVGPLKAEIDSMR